MTDTREVSEKDTITFRLVLLGDRTIKGVNFFFTDTVDQLKRRFPKMVIIDGYVHPWGECSTGRKIVSSEWGF